MSNVIPANFGRVSSKFAGVQIANDAAAGIESGYGIMKYKGKVWTVDYRGESKRIDRPDGDGPANSIDVVVVYASSVKSKLYYKGYNDGAADRPLCFSSNGVTPDQRAQQPQAKACAVCPMNQRGSRVDENGQARGTACRDNKRVAIIPLGAPGDLDTLRNEIYGGPMLLRIPAASLNDFAMFTTKLEHCGLPYCALGMKISFDPDQAYPKFLFSYVRSLTDEEADIVIGMRSSPQVKRIISEDVGNLPATPQVVHDDGLAKLTAPSAKFAAVKDEEPEEAPAPVAKKAAPKKAAAPAPAPVEDEEQTTGTSLDDELDALLA